VAKLTLKQGAIRVRKKKQDGKKGKVILKREKKTDLVDEGQL